MATSQDTAKIQLWSLDTPNGIKINIALEELGLPFECHTVNIMEGEQHRPPFVELCPNGKIPAILDPNGPDGKPIVLWESGAILLYLAEKTKKLMPLDAHGKWDTTKWVFWQMAGLGPMFGQFGHFFKYAPKSGHVEQYSIERYKKEVQRLLGVLDKQLEGKDWIIGDQYTIADVATFPWVHGLEQFYAAGEELQLKDFANVQAWQERNLKRPAVRRGLEPHCPFASAS